MTEFEIEALHYQIKSQPPINDTVIGYFFEVRKAQNLTLTFIEVSKMELREKYEEFNRQRYGGANYNYVAFYIVYDAQIIYLVEDFRPTLKQWFIYWWSPTNSQSSPPQ